MQNDLVLHITTKKKDKNTSRYVNKMRKPSRQKTTVIMNQRIDHLREEKQKKKISKKKSKRSQTNRSSALDRIAISTDINAAARN